MSFIASICEAVSEKPKGKYTNFYLENIMSCVRLESGFMQHSNAFRHMNTISLSNFDNILMHQMINK